MSAKTLISQQSTTGAGPWKSIDPAKKRTVQVVITGVASVSIEASNDGSNPVTLQSGITASGGFVDDDPWQSLRANVVSITSGTVSVVVGEP